MKVEVITNSKKVFFGFQTSGVKGRFVKDRNESETEWARAVNDREIGLILIDVFVYDQLKEKVREHEQKLKFPLVLVIPSDEHEPMLGDNLTKIIKEAIGIKV
ncbi:MAG TPA: hypothetical protein ENN73_01505 [Firmicutes bacterium]|nr:hypothetical protein [Bacillota bacterium]